MTIDAAQQFIQQAVNDPELVSRINSAPDNTAILNILSEKEMVFDYEQFEKAYYNVLTWCQNHAQANAVKEIKLWWDCLGYCMNTSAK